MHWLRRYGRLLRLASHILNGVLLTILLGGLLRMSFDTPLYQRVTQWWLRQIPRILGVRVNVYGEPAATPVLMVANHISWLDIALLGGYSQPRFLSKQEVRTWPVVGWLAATSGTLFITRGKAGAAAQAAATIGEALQAGRTVLLFPEGTTTTGNDVRTFHARLLAPALDAGIAVQPVALRYPQEDGLTHPLIPYVDRQSLWDNLQGILGEPCFSAEIHFLPVLQTAGTDRKTVAAACEQQIRNIVRQI
ncbi:MAG: lysophospholipid acyltransferase family protein [Thiothrix sp.]